MITQSQFNTQIVPFTLQYEGGYANVTGDRGGETYRGISRKYNPNWTGWVTVDASKPLSHNQILPSLETSVKSYYWQKYFTAYNFHLFNSTDIALALFDFAVHGGYSASELKQRVNTELGKSLNTSNSLSSTDIAGLNKVRKAKLKEIIQQLRSEHVRDILAANPSQSKFASGWYERITSLSEIIGLAQRHPWRTVAIIAGVGIAVFAISYAIQINRSKTYNVA